MVRLKSRGKRPTFSPNVLILSSDSSAGSSYSVNQLASEVDLEWCIMAKKNKDNRQVMTRSYTKDRGPGQSVVGPDGYWVDSQYLFVRKYEIDESFFYGDFSYQYQHRQANAIPGPYDQARLDAAFSKMVLSEVLYPLSPKYDAYPDSDMDAAVRSIFHLGPEIQWRWPRHGERIFHRPADWYVGVWLEHLRSGWTPQCHIFVKHL